MVHLEREAAQKRTHSSANPRVTIRVCAPQVSFCIRHHCAREELEARQSQEYCEKLQRLVMSCVSCTACIRDAHNVYTYTRIHYVACHACTACYLLLVLGQGVEYLQQSHI